MCRWKYGQRAVSEFEWIGVFAVNMKIVVHNFFFKVFLSSLTKTHASLIQQISSTASVNSPTPAFAWGATPLFLVQEWGGGGGGSVGATGRR